MNDQDHIRTFATPPDEKVLLTDTPLLFAVGFVPDSGEKRKQLDIVIIAPHSKANILDTVDLLPERIGSYTRLEFGYVYLPTSCVTIYALRGHTIEQWSPTQLNHEWWMRLLLRQLARTITAVREKLDSTDIGSRGEF